MYMMDMIKKPGNIIALHLILKIGKKKKKDLNKKILKLKKISRI